MLLIALWVRSYHINQCVVVPMGNTRYYAQHIVGRFVFARASNAVSMRQPIDDPKKWNETLSSRENALGARIARDPWSDLYVVQTPCWWSVVSIAVIGVLPWIPFRFSLRTLLIAATLVAVVLGIIVVFNR